MKYSKYTFLVECDNQYTHSSNCTVAVAITITCNENRNNLTQQKIDDRQWTLLIRCCYNIINGYSRLETAQHTLH